MSKNQSGLSRIIPNFKDPVLVNPEGFLYSKKTNFLPYIWLANTKTSIMDTKGTFMSAFEAFITKESEELPDPLQSSGEHMLLYYP